MENKSGGMNIRLTPEAFQFFCKNKPCWTGTAKHMADVLENYYQQNLKKGENNAGELQEIPNKSV